MAGGLTTTLYVENQKVNTLWDLPKYWSAVAVQHLIFLLGMWKCLEGICILRKISGKCKWSPSNQPKNCNRKKKMFQRPSNASLNNIIAGFLFNIIKTAMFLNCQLWRTEAKRLRQQMDDLQENYRFTYYFFQEHA